MDTTLVDSEGDGEGDLVIDEKEEGEIYEEEEEGKDGMEYIDEEETEIEMMIEEEDSEREKGMGSRMTLRPHNESKPCSSSLVTDMVSPPASSFSAPPGGLPSTPTATTGLHRRMQWAIGDMLTFYEGVKQYGKDFDALTRVMSKRKSDINKEQLRNFFFNFYRQVRSGADLKEDDWPAEMSRDARDLFVVINGCEWRKRMGNYKFDPVKLKTLIMEGSAVTRVRCKKQHVTLKTPCCPALLQFFSFNRRITRFPPDIILYLSPLRYRDGNNVLSRGQNPKLCVRLNTCDRMERVFDLLDHKWKGTVEEEEDEDGEEEDREGEDGEMNGRKRPFTVKLYPSKNTVMGDLTYIPSTSSYGNISINMLHEDRTKAENMKRQFKKGGENGEPCYQVSQSLISHLTLSRSSLLTGITRETVGSASIAELYAVCGLSRDITLQYSIEESEDEMGEPWNILVDLIGKGYGEAVTEKKAAAVNRSSSRDDPIQMDDWSMNQPQRKRVRVMKTQPPSVPFYITQSDIVTKEMDDFAEQVRGLASAPRKRRSPVRNKSLSTHKRTASLSLGTTPFRIASSAASTPSRMTTFPPIGNDPMARALRAAFTSPDTSLQEAPSTSRATRPLSHAVFNSPMKTNSSLPSDVRASLEQMQSQNSVEYCMQFSTLFDGTLDLSPSKLANL